MSSNQISLADQIRNATPGTSVAHLLQVGETYESASNGTRRKWRRLAAAHANKAPVGEVLPVPAKKAKAAK